MIVKGYTYNTEAEAQTAQTTLDNYYGIPLPESSTLNILTYENYEDKGYWYILWTDNPKVQAPNSVTEVLGEPDDIEIPDAPILTE